jgi:ABC transport system ATP-binding/permease protein
MVQLVARGIEKSFGDRVILRGCDIRVGPKERIGLVGVNGGGKSTLLSILAGAEVPDAGEVIQQGRLGLLRQNAPLPGRTVGDAADEAVAWHRTLLVDYEAALIAEDFATSSAIQDQLDHHGWEVEHRVEAILSRLDAPPRDRLLDELSGGEARRVALARVLLDAPDLLLLDEPTNHLDAATVDWLQGVLRAWHGAVVLVTHDRYLLEAMAERIVEVEDGVCVSYSGSYADYLLSRAERRSQMERGQDRRLALITREAAWAARSPAARSTKQKGRLQRLDALRAQRDISRERLFSLDFHIADAGGTVLELDRVSKAYPGKNLIEELDLALLPGERIGVFGPNGAGKSTLLRLLRGEETPDAGEIRKGARISIGVLDQERSGLDPDDTVMIAAGRGATHVEIAGTVVHTSSFLERFLFDRTMFHQKVRSLSGGERARLLLVRLLLEGCNLLLLDEPTNDLDLQTLRVLEEALMGFAGTAIVVTHDRAFLDRVCTSVLAFEGDGVVVQYASRSQYIQVTEAKRRQAVRDAKEAPVAAPVVRERVPGAPKLEKLSFKERADLEALPTRIETLETEQAAVEARLGAPEIYRDGTDVSAITQRLAEIGPELAVLYERWTSLEERA